MTPTKPLKKPPTVVRFLEETTVPLGVACLAGYATGDLAGFDEGTAYALVKAGKAEFVPRQQER